MNKKLKSRVFEVFGTQSDFATFLGIHESKVSQVIRGRRSLSIPDQERWAAALNSSVELIF